MLAALGHRLGTVSLALLCPALAVVLGACGGAPVQSSRDDSLCNGEYKEGWPGDYLELLLSDTNPNLCRADLRHANLSGRKLVGANLYEARLDEAHLEGAEMSGANLRRAILSSPGAIRDAQNRPRGPFLSGADLGGADLTDAQLGGADLRWASLVSAKLQRATFYQAHLAGADLFGANLEGANLEALRGLPDPEDIAGAENLEAIRFNRPPTAVQLREAFKRGGFRQQERQLTYAIKRRERIASGGIEGAAMYVLFELPCLYGMAPGRPLWILLAFIGVFSVPYTVALGRQGTAGIWAVPLPDRVHGQDSGVHPIRVTRNFPAWTREIASASSGRQPPTRPPQRRWRGIGSVVFGAAGSRRHRCAMFVVGNAGVPLYFSVVSAFHLGWRDLNVGSWVSRIQPREYSLRATGWVRTMAGIQSVISVYLVALWALSYFGRPFE